MGDDQGDDFEISEAALITEGGGGAYGNEEEAASASEDDDDNTKISPEQVGSWTGMQDKGKKSSEKKVKRKDKLLEMKSAKKRRGKGLTLGSVQSRNKEGAHPYATLYRLFANERKVIVQGVSWWPWKA